MLNSTKMFFKFFLAVIFYSFHSENLWAYYDFFPSKKIAFVKQVTNIGLYVAPTNASNSEIIFSSFAASGPVALFTKFNADFFIVDTEPDAECNVWKEKVSGCKHKLEFFESLRTVIPPHGERAGHKYPQGKFMVKCDAIDWSKYDIVISLDISVPARITKKYPKVLWAYYVSEGCQPAFYESRKKPINGYDIYFTQNYQESPVLPAHVLEFPYQLQYYGCIHELFGVSEKELIRNKINLETHTNYILSQGQKKLLNLIMPTITANGSIKDLLGHLLHSKYYVQFLEPQQGKRHGVLGNGIVEGVATGNLVISNGFGLANDGLLTPRTRVKNFKELVERIVFFENNPSALQEELKLQRAKLDRLCFTRPIAQLFDKHNKKVAKLK